MTPEQVAACYDRIADRWLDLSIDGFAQIERAVAFVDRKGAALDVGCAGRAAASTCWPGTASPRTASTYPRR